MKSIVYLILISLLTLNNVLAFNYQTTVANNWTCDNFDNIKQSSSYYQLTCEPDVFTPINNNDIDNSISDPIIPLTSKDGKMDTFREYNHSKDKTSVQPIICNDYGYCSSGWY